jgi:hypothetical protein
LDSSTSNSFYQLQKLRALLFCQHFTHKSSKHTHIITQSFVFFGKIDLIVFDEVILGWYRAETKEYHEKIAENIPSVFVFISTEIWKIKAYPTYTP